jgi:hypothetical protein
VITATSDVGMATGKLENIDDRFLKNDSHLLKFYFLTVVWYKGKELVCKPLGKLLKTMNASKELKKITYHFNLS